MLFAQKPLGGKPEGGNNSKYIDNLRKCLFADVPINNA